MVFRPDMTELDRLLKTPGSPVGRHVNLVARTIAAEAQRIATERGLVRSSRYVKGFRVEVVPEGDSYYFQVVNRVRGQDPRRSESYAGVIEYGSEEHPIRPRNRNRWLVFRMPDGRIVKTKLVNHRGTTAQHVLRDATNRVSKFL